MAVLLGAERLPIFDLNEQQASILFDIRLPRILLGACVGRVWRWRGAGLQSLLRNPLAEPYLLGVSNGAALGTMLAFVFSEPGDHAAIACVCGSGARDGRRLSNGEEPGGDECRAVDFVGGDRHHFFIVRDRDARRCWTRRSSEASHFGSSATFRKPRGTAFISALEP
ncbi:MAG: iron chelate uptake ABC transporter family permease subunit [Chloracidobacterium sp.]|nr:iron chelate uptake ABC transporter family permease subunit [Chloracidobacterium sp.]